MKNACRCLVVGIATALLAGLAQAQIQFALVEKQVSYTQNSTSAPGVSSGTPYTFRFNVEGAGSSSLSAYTPVSITTTPSGSGVGSVILSSGSDYNSSEDRWEQAFTYGDKSSLDGAFKNGVYTLNIKNTTNHTITLGSGGSYLDAYPEAAPMVTGLSAGDFDGLNRLKIDLSLTTYTFNFNSSAFTSYTSGGHIGAFVNGVSDGSGNVNAESFYVGATTDPAISTLTFNPSTSNMVAGNPYTLEIEYNILTDAAINRFGDGPDENSAGLFTYRTTLTIIAIPEPSTYAAIFGGLACPGVAFKRRRALAG